MTPDAADAYLGTEISIALPDAGWVSAADALAVLGSPIHVLTAWNPGPERPSLEVNRSANAELRRRLLEKASTIYPALGSSPEADHHEESYALAGIDRSSAVELGRAFGQAAIFELSGSTQTVVGCDSPWELARPL